MELDGKLGGVDLKIHELDDRSNHLVTTNRFIWSNVLITD